MEEKISGIVLSSISFSENDKILNIFTIEHGTISAKIKGVKKAGAKLKFASEPFCFAEFIFLNKNGFRTVIGASLIDSFYPIREDLKKFYAGAVVLEFIKHFAKENIVSPNLFLSAIDTLKEMAYNNKVLPSLVAFLTNGLKTVGYALNINGCADCGKNIEGKVYFDYKTGGFYCENCNFGRGKEIQSITYKTFLHVKANKNISEEDGVNAIRLLDFYLKNKTEEKLNSLAELIALVK